MSPIIAALTFVHVFSAIGYLGSAMTFGLVIGPRLPKLTGSASNEFFAKIGPAFVRFAELFGSLTIVFGVLLLYAMTGFDPTLFLPSSSWGLSISVGMATGLGGFLIGNIWITRSAKRLVRYAQNLLEKSEMPPQAEMLRAANTLKISSALSLLLLIVTVVFMVVAGSI